MDITNKVELDAFLNKAKEVGHICRGVKGRPPKGMTYSDGELIKNDINVAWEDTTTGEICEIIYGGNCTDGACGVCHNCMIDPV